MADDIQSETALDERRPLLPKTDDDLDRPLPKGQLALLAFSRFVEPVAYFSIFPFCSQMVFETGIPQDQAGFYVGLIESLFSLTQLLVMPFWGKLSDKRGRKGILVISMFGLSITSTLFGLSKTPWQMIMFRCLSGLFSGSTVTIRTMTAEISTPKTQATAFSWFAFAGNAAIFFAPLMGGLLSKPADNFSLFRQWRLFVDYPYLLPCMFTGLLALTVAIIDLLLLKETLHTKTSETGDRVPAAEYTTKQLLKSEGVAMVLFINLSTMLLAFSYTALNPLMSFTPIRLGGFGLTPQQISLLLAIGGFCQTFWVLVVFPPLHKRIGSRGMFLWAGVVWPLFSLAYPVINLALRKGMSSTGFWIAGAALGAFGSSVCMSYTSTQLIVNDIVPHSSALGALNGIALSGISAIRAVAPAAASSIYAVGVENRILSGQLAWIILGLLGLAYNIVVRQLPRKAWGLTS